MEEESILALSLGDDSLGKGCSVATGDIGVCVPLVGDLPWWKVWHVLGMVWSKHLLWGMASHEFPGQM